MTNSCLIIESRKYPKWEEKANEASNRLRHLKFGIAVPSIVPRPEKLPESMMLQRATLHPSLCIYNRDGISTSMLENWCITTCRLNESGSGSCLSDSDSNLLCCQILESISRPRLFHCGPHQTWCEPQACCKAPAVPPSCASNWKGNKTEFLQIWERKKRKEKEILVCHIWRLSAFQSLTEGTNNCKAHCKTQI